MKRALALLLLAGCSGSRTEMIVRVVAGDSGVLTQIDHLALVISDADLQREEYRVMSTALCDAAPGKGCVELPAEIVLYPGPKNPGDTVEVELTGLQGDTARIDTAARFQFVTGQSETLTLALNSACLDRVPACAANPDAPYCESDGSCGQPGGLGGSDGGTRDQSPRDQSLPDLELVDEAAPADAAEADFSAPDLERPDLLMPDLTSCLMSGSDVYVDRVLGSDDAGHGGGSGACAWKSITYALANTSAGAVLHLAASQTFKSGETFPLIVAGQKLMCGNATGISGAGPTGSATQEILELTSPGSAVQGCNLDPGPPDSGCTSSATDYTAVHVTGSGSALSPITIDHCIAVHSLITLGVYINDGLHDIVISNSTLAAINSVQTGSNVTAQISNNHLDPGCGGTTFSVRCAVSDSVSILGNTSNGSSTLSCSGSCYSSGPPAGQQCP